MPLVILMSDDPDRVTDGIGVAVDGDWGGKFQHELRILIV